MSKPAALPSLLTVMDGDKRCIGHLLKRGNVFEAFDINDASLGTFPSMQDAADAVSSASAAFI